SPDLPEGWPLALVPGALAGIGLAQVGTLAAEVTAGLRTRTTLAPLIVAPLAVPLLIAASQALESLASDGGILPWPVLVVAAALAPAVLGAALARPLVEASLWAIGRPGCGRGKCPPRWPSPSGWSWLSGPPSMPSRASTPGSCTSTFPRPGWRSWRSASRPWVRCSGASVGTAVGTGWRQRRRNWEWCSRRCLSSPDPCGAG